MAISLEGDRIKNAENTLSVRQYTTPDTKGGGFLEKAFAWLAKPWFLQRRFELVYCKMDEVHQFVWVNKESFKKATGGMVLTNEVFRKVFGVDEKEIDFLSTIQSCTKSPLTALELQTTFAKYKELKEGGEALPDKLEKKEHRLARSILFDPVTDDGILLMSSARSKKDKILGRGSFKTAKYGINLRTGERVVVAITRIPTDMKIKEDIALKTIASEDIAAEQLKGIPGIVDVLFTRKVNQKHYVVMKDYNIGNLEEALDFDLMFDREKIDEFGERVQSLKRWSPNEKVKIKIAKQLLGALAATHAKGILHTDIKSANVLLDEDMNAVLADWGVAQTVEKAQTREKWSGTPHYYAPEREHIPSSKQSKASDCYALGLTLLQLFVPDMMRNLNGLTLKEIVKRSKNCLNIHQQHMPRSIHDAISGLIKKNPNNRMTAQAALDLLSNPRELGEAEIHPLEIED